MSQNFMTITIKRRAEWVFYALEPGSSGVHTEISRVLKVMGRKHLDQFPRA